MPEPTTDLQSDLMNWDYLRPEIQAFATAMEHQLRLNDWKGGWAREDLHYLRRRLTTELKELRQTFVKGYGGNRATVAEAADVANFAMMIADKTKVLNWIQEHAMRHPFQRGRNDECKFHS